MIAMFARRSAAPIGLDIGRTAIRAVQLDRRHGSLHAALELPLPDHDAQPSAKAADHLAASLRHLLQRGEFIGRDVVLHCPPDRLDLRPVELPAARDLPRDAVLGALRLQLGGQLPFDINDAVFDYFPAGPAGPQRTRVMAVTADGAWLRKRLRVVQDAGLHCAAIEAFPCALARLLDTPENEFHPNTVNHPAQPDSETTENVLTALLDVGQSGSTLVVFATAGPIFCRRFQLGGHELTQTIAQRLGIDLDLAERLKRRFGIDNRTRRLRLAAAPAAPPLDLDPHALPQLHLDQAEMEGEVLPEPSQDHEIAKTLFAALQLQLSDYTEGLVRSLNYVITHETSCRLDRVLLCGRGAQLRNLDAWLTDQFDLPVLHWRDQILDQILDDQPASRSCPGSWTTALALARAGRKSP
jgi:Tfp pilus assembly PilM family ATPase